MLVYCISSNLLVSVVPYEIQLDVLYSNLANFPVIILFTDKL